MRFHCRVRVHGSTYLRWFAHNIMVGSGGRLHSSNPYCVSFTSLSPEEKSNLPDPYWPTPMFISNDSAGRGRAGGETAGYRAVKERVLTALSRLDRGPVVNVFPRPLFPVPGVEIRWNFPFSGSLRGNRSEFSIFFFRMGKFVYFYNDFFPVLLRFYRIFLGGGYGKFSSGQAPKSFVNMLMFCIHSRKARDFTVSTSILSQPYTYLLNLYKTVFGGRG